jgi:hypothetical protein
MTLLLQLRDAAKKCSNPEWQVGLRKLADDLNDSTVLFYTDPTAERLITVNGLWARGEWLLKNVPPEAEPTPPQTLFGDTQGNVMRKAA